MPISTIPTRRLVANVLSPIYVSVSDASIQLPRLSLLLGRHRRPEVLKACKILLGLPRLGALAHCVLGQQEIVDDSAQRPHPKVLELALLIVPISFQIEHCKKLCRR